MPASDTESDEDASCKSMHPITLILNPDLFGVGSETQDAVIIDPVLDFDAGSVRVYGPLAELYEAVESRQLLVRAVMDTHVHADHLSGMAEVCIDMGARALWAVACGRYFRPLFHCWA